MPTKNKDSTRYYSNKQEESVSKAIGGYRQSNSGASKFAAGDVTNTFASLLIECKTCTKEKESFSIKKEWITKNREEARSKRLSNAVVAFNFGPDQENFYIINESLMKLLVRQLEEIYRD